MRAIHFGDLHCKEGALFDEFQRVVVDFIPEVIRSEQPDVATCGGDIYDGASTPLERLVVAEFVQRVTEVCPLVISRGNHDRIRELLLLLELRTKHPVHVIETCGVVPVGDGLGIAVMGWPSMASSLDMAATQEAVRDVLRGLRADLERFENRLLLGHFQTTDAVSSTGQPLVGRGIDVSLSDLALAGGHAVLMSHIHKPQHFDFGDMPAIFAGSPFRTDHGEHEEKSLVRLSVEHGRVTWGRIPTPARPMLLVEGRHQVTSSLDSLPPTLLGGMAIDDAPADVRNADIRFVYRVEADRREEARRAAEELRDRWLAEGAATVKLEPEIVTTTRARAPEIVRARTLDEKLAALWAAKSDVPEPARAARLLSKVHQLQEVHP